MRPSLAGEGQAAGQGEVRSASNLIASSRGAGQQSRSSRHKRCVRVLRRGGRTELAPLTAPGQAGQGAPRFAGDVAAELRHVVAYGHTHEVGVLADAAIAIVA